MDIAKKLDLFLDVVQQGSYTKAAHLRNMDRSSLSKQVMLLEHELGTRLLNRSTRSLSVTQAGEEVLKQAEALRQTIVDTRKIVESFNSEPKGLLRITSPTLFGKMYVQEAIKVFMRRYPEVHVQLMLDNKKLNIIEDRYDIAFRIGQVQNSNLIAKKLADNKPVILASAQFIEDYGEPQSPQDLVKLPAVFYENDGLVVNKIPIYNQEKKRDTEFWEFTGRYRVNEQELILDALKAGLGFAVLGQYMLDKHISELGLVRLLPDHELVDYYGSIYALYPHRNPTPLVKEFIGTVQAMIGDTPIWERHFI